MLLEMVKNVDLFNFINTVFYKTGLRWLWLTIIILVVDYSSKLLIMYNFFLGEIIPISPLVNLYYVRNYGTAFNLLSHIHDGWQQFLFFIISTTICIVLVLMMYQSPVSNKLNNIAYAMILGGALGNLLDRMCHGFVIDMIDIYINNWHFATFNIADVSIFISIISFIIKDLYSRYTL